MARRSDRDFLKDTVRLETDFSLTPQSRGVPPPPVEKPCPEGAETVELERPGAWSAVAPLPLAEAIAARRSRRRYHPAPLALGELAFLLWATQGVRDARGPSAVFRTVPSAGCRHPFETYVCALNVAGLGTALWRYLPLSHRLCRVRDVPNLAARVAEAALGQAFLARAAAVFVWTALPARTEWRYGPASVKVIALDAGHVCQNLYLACEAVGAGACAVAAYHQGKADALVGADGTEEFVVYLAPVGKVGAPQGPG